MKAIKWIIIGCFFHLNCFQHGSFSPRCMTDSVIVNGNNMLDQTDFPLLQILGNEGYTI